MQNPLCRNAECYCDGKHECAFRRTDVMVVPKAPLPPTAGPMDWSKAIAYLEGYGKEQSYDSQLRVRFRRPYSELTTALANALRAGLAIERPAPVRKSV